MLDDQGMQGKVSDGDFRPDVPWGRDNPRVTVCVRVYASACVPYCALIDCPSGNGEISYLAGLSESMSQKRPARESAARSVSRYDNNK